MWVLGLILARVGTKRGSTVREGRPPTLPGGEGLGENGSGAIPEASTRARSHRSLPEGRLRCPKLFPPPWRWSARRKTPNTSASVSCFCPFHCGPGKKMRGSFPWTDATKKKPRQHSRFPLRQPGCRGLAALDPWLCVTAFRTVLPLAQTKGRNTPYHESSVEKKMFLSREKRDPGAGEGPGAPRRILGGVTVRLRALWACV